MDITTTILTDLFPLVLPLFLAIVVVVGKYALARLPENQHAIITSVAQTAVTAVEQVHLGTPGSDKRMIAENVIVEMLAAMHIKVAPALIDAAIESAVYALKQNAPVAPVAPEPVAPAAQVQHIQGAA